jgi:glycerol kinase
MNNLLMQFQADLLGVTIVRPAVIETTALGAAYLAGLAVGYWRNMQEIAVQWRIESRFEPRMPRKHAHTLRERWRAALERAKGWKPVKRDES